MINKYIVDKEMFSNIDHTAIEEIRKLYKAQCPAIFNKGMNVDNNLLTILAIGKSIRFEYLQCLVDSYDQFRIKNPHKIMSPIQWASLPQNKHFQSSLFRDLKVAVPSKTGKGTQITEYRDFAAHCIPSFSGKIGAALILPSIYKINDSIEDTITLIHTLAFIKPDRTTSNVSIST